MDPRRNGLFAWGCQPWMDRRFRNIGVVDDRIRGIISREFAKLIDNSYHEGRLSYWWENVTVLAPDPEREEWKGLGLVDE
jgi:hypothetical protein